MGTLRRIVDLFVYGRWTEVEMEPQSHTTIDPDRQARVNQVVSETADYIAASTQIRTFSEAATVKLANAVQQATGMIGTDLLADRQGRLSKSKGHRA